MKSFFKAFIFAVQFLTRIPIPVVMQPDKRIASCCLALFPLVGWLIGAILYSLCIILLLPGKFSPLTVAVFIVAAETMLTGAFHLDGLADSFDAFFSTAKSPEQKLEIMKDSRIGVMGAAALMLGLLIKIMLISECIRYDLKAVIMIYPAMGRLAQVTLYRIGTYVRPGGIGGVFAQAGSPKIVWCAIALMLPSLLVISAHLFLAFALFACFVAYYNYYAKCQIGGITGDVLGSATVLSELVFLAAFSVGIFL